MKKKDLLIILINTLVVGAIAFFFLKKFKLKDEQITGHKSHNNTVVDGEKYDRCDTVKFVKTNKGKTHHLENFTCLKAKPSRSPVYSELINKLGWGKIGKSQIKNIVKVDGEKIYNKTYFTDSTGFREVLGNKENAKEHIIISGDSFVFGDGLNQDETIMYFLSKKYPKKNIYPIAYSGYSAAQTWLFLKYFDPKKWIKEESGHLVSMHFDFHNERICGSEAYLGWSGKKGPYLKIENDKLVHKGFLDDPSKFVEAKECIELMSELYLDIQKTYISHFPKGNYTVAIATIYGNQKSDFNWELVQKLREKGVNVRVFYDGVADEDVMNMAQGKYSYPIEGHPNKAGAEYLARRIQKIISKIK
jgi:hypothetical protein